MSGGAGEAERGEFVREVAVLACLEVLLWIQTQIKLFWLKVYCYVYSKLNFYLIIWSPGSPYSPGAWPWHLWSGASLCGDGIPGARGPDLLLGLPPARGHPLPPPRHQDPLLPHPRLHGRPGGVKANLFLFLIDNLSYRWPLGWNTLKV